MLQQGSVRKRPPMGKAQARPGVSPISSHADTHFEPLPEPLGPAPYHFDLETVLPGIDAKAAELGQLVFHVVGDTGGVKDGTFQAAVAAQMKTDLNNPEETRPQFFYHLGDVVYFNGEISEYYSQFYEPYDHYEAPILAIPGNHDGDPNLANPESSSLDGFIEYFMTAEPHIDPISGDAQRVTLSLPNVYWTLNAPFVTIVGMYTNVPEGGSVDSVQSQWLLNEFATAPKDKALIVALHHPIYSFDDHHSGSAAMADVLEHAINETRRVPNLVFSAHVHNYQRLEREIIPGTKSPFIVAGSGGYYHRHNLTATKDQRDEEFGVQLMHGEDKHHAYVTLSVGADKITGTMMSIASTGAKAHQHDATTDAFEYPGGLLTLPDGVTIKL